METFLIFLLFAAAAILFILLAYFLIRSLFQSENRQYITVTNLSAARRYYTANRDRSLAIIYVRVKLHDMADIYSTDVITKAYTKVGCLLLNIVKSDAENVVAAIEDKDFLILSATVENNFEEFCDKFYKDLTLYGAEHHLHKLPNVSFGMYLPKNARVSFEEALLNAKQTYRYASSKHKKYASCSYDMLCQFEETEQIEQYVETAIENNSFHMMLQPYIDLTTHQVIGCELLARLKHPVSGLIMPDTFLEMIDKKGLNIAFDYGIFNKCCEWLASRPPETMAGRTITCNFSRQTLSCADFAEQLKTIADRYGVPCDRIAIEITEHKKENDFAVVLSNISKLHQLGFQVFLDDYGTGFSNYSDIKNYPVDLLKLDKEFLYNSNTRTGKAMFENIIELAAKLGIAVLCEGVETEEQEEFIRQSGCKFAQGFYYYMPMEAHSCSKLFSENPIK